VAGLVAVSVAMSPPVIAPRWERLPVKLLVAAPVTRLAVRDPVLVPFSGRSVPFAAPAPLQG